MTLRIPALLRRPFRRFTKDESGQVLIEFVLVVPIIFSCFLMCVELGLYSIREMFLDRGLDMAVRHLRIAPGSTHTHASVKAEICEFAGFLEDCDATLNLEMAPVNPRTFTGFDDDADCVDISQPVRPQRQFVTGSNNTLMLLRACYRFQPVFATSGLGEAFEKDGSGRAKMISVAAFVTEPN